MPLPSLPLPWPRQIPLVWLKLLTRRGAWRKEGRCLWEKDSTRAAPSTLFPAQPRTLLCIRHARRYSHTCTRIDTQRQHFPPDQLPSHVKTVSRVHSQMDSEKRSLACSAGPQPAKTAFVWSRPQIRPRPGPRTQVQLCSQKDPLPSWRLTSQALFLGGTLRLALPSQCLKSHQALSLRGNSSYAT